LVAAEVPTGGSTLDEVDSGVGDDLSRKSLVRRQDVTSVTGRPSRPEETVYLLHKHSPVVTTHCIVIARVMFTNMKLRKVVRQFGLVTLSYVTVFKLVEAVIYQNKRKTVFL